LPPPEELELELLLLPHPAATTAMTSAESAAKRPTFTLRRRVTLRAFRI
jgi:hypothetical protein